MSPSPEITMRLANRLKEERASKGLSLEALAKLSGVSRSMLSQIERGESSPTVASLWNLTRALNVDFSELLDEESASNGPIFEFVRNDQVPFIERKGSGCLIRILSAPEDVGETEVYDIQFEKGAVLDSAPHKKGCVEHLTALQGKLTVTSDNQKVEVSTGDTVRYAADKDHSIAAKDKARALLIVKNA
ncbi:MAG: helix-turn-helix domain-containing protein [Hyphomicrobiales bacterium]